MKKTVIKKMPVTNSNTQPEKSKETYYQIPVTKIAFSPLNYRKTYDQKSLEEFAGHLKGNELIAPILVRPGKRNGYELVIGERRLRAAQLAGLKTLPARIKQLTDEEVTEQQLAENLQRENPHPVHEAQAVLFLQQGGKTIEEIASKLGKSQAFVYNRLKLATMIDPFKEMFVAGKINMRNALDIAALAEDSQKEFFEKHCADWKTSKVFTFDRLNWTMNKYKYDLRNAPFDIKDKSLLPDAGTCSGCPFNSATLKSLFPELSKEAICSNKTCFKTKCRISAERAVLQSINNFKPETILINNFHNEEYISVIDASKELKELPRKNNNDVTIISKPVAPNKESHQQWNKDKTKLIFNPKSYRHAVEEHKNDMAEYELEIKKDTTQKALYITGDGVKAVYLNPFVRKTGNSGSSAKDLQEAIKQGKVTTELLTNEINRINTREIRAKELDREKVQLKTHEQFCEALQKGTLKKQLVNADKVTARFIVYEALGYMSKTRLDKILFPNGKMTNEAFFEGLSKMKDEHFSDMIRSVVSTKGESKNPNSMFAYCLTKIAAEAGMNLTAIEKEQGAKTEQREAKIRSRVKDLQKQVKQLSLKKAA